jgi:hypothetical protein
MREAARMKKYWGEALRRLQETLASSGEVTA